MENSPERVPSSASGKCLPDQLWGFQLTTENQSLSSFPPLHQWQSWCPGGKQWWCLRSRRVHRVSCSSAGSQHLSNNTNSNSSVNRSYQPNSSRRLWNSNFPHLLSPHWWILLDTTNLSEILPKKCLPTLHPFDRYLENFHEVWQSISVLFF